MRELAAAASVNPATMAKAVSELAASGLLDVRHGAGITFTGGSREAPPNPRTARHVPTWEGIRDTLASGIVTGALATDGVLPSRKELRARFGAGAWSVNRALNDLARGGLIERFGRGYRLTLRRDEVRGATLVVVAVSEDMDLMASYTNRSPEFWRTLEHACRRHALSLRVVSYAKVLGRVPPDPESRRLMRSGGTLGFLVWAHGLASAMHELVPALCTRGKPVAVTDEHTGVSLPHLPRSRSPVVLFPVAGNERAGADVARYLLGREHRNVAYFSRSAMDPWSEQRLVGLRRAFRGAGLPEAVTVFDADTPIEWGTFRNRWGADARTRTLLSRTRNLARTAGGKGNLSAARVSAQVLNYLWDEYLAVHLMPQFVEALATPRLTAWVCANDEVGRSAIAFLRSRSLEPGRSRAVIGFDDEITASGAGLSSYNFGVAAQALACLRFILNPTGMPGLHATAEIPGFVVTRTSTRESVGTQLQS
jgi:DNA-binding LacI/PurR family transcriptional regulator/DNA-binding transcriptional regulator YhcF (GntR family)